MVKHKNSSKTVAVILKGKQARIMTAQLEKGAPAWKDILELTWEEIVDRARRRRRGYRTIKKLLEKSEYDK